MSGNFQSNHKPNICFVSLDNYAALVDDPKFGRIGGAERQQVLIGKELAMRGHNVSFITLDHGQDEEVEIDKIRIIKAYEQDVGIRGFRFLHPRLTSLWRAMKKADADIYYQRTRDSTTGLVAAFCRRHCRKFVFAIAHDTDCITDLRHCPTRHERVLYRYGLRWANLVIAQTATQQRLLRENFGVDSIIIPNCAPDYGRCLSGADVVPCARGRRLLWVGQFRPSKRLELLLDFAEQCQDLQFDVLGDGNSESEYVQRLRSRARSISNVHLHGTVPHAYVQPFYQRTAALICTSSIEGFPNIFLEAWSCGLPIISTFDPDNIIADNGLGIVAKNVLELVDGIRDLFGSKKRQQNISQRVRQFYLENYTVHTVMAKFEIVLTDLCRK